MSTKKKTNKKIQKNSFFISMNSALQAENISARSLTSDIEGYVYFEMSSTLIFLLLVMTK